jgi:hypothetical protein
MQANLPIKREGKKEGEEEEEEEKSAVDRLASILTKY